MWRRGDSLISKMIVNNKYHAKPVTWQGERFDSRAEWRRWMILKEDERLGRIRLVVRQPRFTLMLGPNYNDGPVSLTYTPDFLVVGKHGDVRCEDVKGFITRGFRERQALWHLRCPEIPLVVVR